MDVIVRRRVHGYSEGFKDGPMGWVLLVLLGEVQQLTHPQLVQHSQWMLLLLLFLCSSRCYCARVCCCKLLVKFLANEEGLAFDLGHDVHSRL